MQNWVYYLKFNFVERALVCKLFNVFTLYLLFLHLSNLISLNIFNQIAYLFPGYKLKARNKALRIFSRFLRRKK